MQHSGAAALRPAEGAERRMTDVTPEAVAPESSRGPYPRAAIVSLGLGGFVVTAFGLWAIQSIAAPVLLALVLVICVNPVRRALEQHGVPRSLATGSVIGVTFILLSGFVAALLVAVAQFSALLPQFGPQLTAFGNAVVTGLRTLGVDGDEVKSFIDEFDPGRLLVLAGELVGSASGLVGGLVIVLTSLLLMSMDAAYAPTLLRAASRSRPDAVSALAGFTLGVRRYMVATTALGAAQGVLNGVALLLMQVPGSFLWGLLSFLCSYIPNVGYFIAIIPPLVFGFLTGGWPVTIAIIVVYGVINAVVQSIIQPWVIGNAVALSQTLTFVSVLFWAVVLGPIGAILAIPLTLLVRTVLVDADPNARWWRPLTGDVEQARAEMKREALASKRSQTNDASRRAFPWWHRR